MMTEAVVPFQYSSPTCRGNTRVSRMGDRIGAGGYLKQVSTILTYDPSDDVAIDMSCVEKDLVVDTCKEPELDGLEPLGLGSRTRLGE